MNTYQFRILKNAFNKLEHNFIMKNKMSLVLLYTYTITLDGKTIGKTKLEKADASMGVVFGMIIDINQKIDYAFIKSYCQNNEIGFDDFPEDNLIFGNQISGTDEDGFEITIEGISYPFYEEEFPHHVKAYNDMD